MFERRASLQTNVTAYCAALVAVLFWWCSVGCFATTNSSAGSWCEPIFGMTLYSSNNDCASSSLIDEERTNCYQSHHPNTSLAEAERLRSLVKSNMIACVFKTQSHGSGLTAAPFARLAMARFRDFWFPPQEDHPFKSVTIWIATLLSIPGLLLMIYRRERVTPFVLFVLAIYPLMYYVVVSDVRYRIPVLWLSLLPAGYFLANIESDQRIEHGEPPPAVSARSQLSFGSARCPPSYCNLSHAEPNA